MSEQRFGPPPGDMAGPGQYAPVEAEQERDADRHAAYVADTMERVERLRLFQRDVRQWGLETAMKGPYVPEGGWPEVLAMQRAGTLPADPGTVRPSNVVPFVRPDAAADLKKRTLAYLDELRARVESGEVVGLFAIEDRGTRWTNAIHVRSYLELVGMLALSQHEVVQYAFMVRDGDR
jgi:hypothetical protein